METIQTLDPRAFRGLICSVGVLPTSFIESMSYYEMIAWLVNYIKTNVVTAVNNHAAALKEIQDWIGTLDLQDEVNNKLDEMAESGQLVEIIAEFLNSQCVFAFDTINDMKASEAMGVGSIARVLGNTNPLTGDGAFYRVRAILNTDTVDGVNKVALTNSSNLIAVRITDAAVDAINTRLNTITNHKYVFVGDSYDDGYNPDGNVEGWGSKLATILGLESGEYVNTHLGGMGFSRPAEYNYYTLINALSSDDTVTDIVIAGSYNDKSASEAAILEGITAVRTLCLTKFPNAKLHIAFIGWSSNSTAKTELIQCYKYYKNACDSFADIDFMENTQYILHQYFTDFASDGIHPTSAGQAKIAKYLAESLINGKCNIAFNAGLVLSPVSSGTLTGTWVTSTQIINDTTTVSFNSTGVITWSAGNYVTISGKSVTKIADITGGVMIGNNNVTCCASCMCITQTSDNVYHSLPCQIIIKEKGLYVQPCLINAAGNNYDSQELKLIQFGALNITVNSLYA